MSARRRGFSPTPKHHRRWLWVPARARAARLAGTTTIFVILQPLDDGHIGHAAAFAHGLQAVALVALLQRIDQRSHQLGAGAAERVAERDRAAIDVEPRRIGAGG